MYYMIVWDQGSQELEHWDTYTIMTSDSYFTNVNGLSSGHPYRFKYRAQNIHGWGPESPLVEVTAMSYPSASNVPVTEVVGSDVRISWDAPYSGGIGVEITRYQILIKDFEGNFIEDLDYCDGENDVDILANNECFIPMSHLRDESYYNLKQGDLVVA